MFGSPGLIEAVWLVAVGALFGFGWSAGRWCWARLIGKIFKG